MHYEITSAALAQRPRLPRFGIVAQLEFRDCDRSVLQITLGLVVIGEAFPEDMQCRIDGFPVLTFQRSRKSLRGRLWSALVMF